MKKLFKLFTLILMATFVFALSACDSDPCKDGHTASEWQIIEDSTCTKEGSAHTVCTVCGIELETKTISKKDHTASEWQVVNDSTCTKEGSEHKVCSVCGEELETRTITKKDHTASDWQVVTEKTCTTDGSEHKVCSVCGEELETRTIAASHNYGEWIEEVKATYVSEGTLGHYHCSECGVDFNENKEVLESIKIDKLVAVMSDVTIKSLPSCTNGFYEAIDLTEAVLEVSWTDETKTEVKVTSDMIKKGIVGVGKNTIEGEYNEFAFDFEVTVVAHSVAEAKALNPGTETLVQGVVAGLTACPNAVELLIKDENTNTYMGIRGLSDVGKIADNTMAYPEGLAQGDLVVAPFTVTVAAVDSPSSDLGKVFLKYNETESITTKVTEHGHNYKVNYEGSDILVIDSEQKLRELYVKNALTGEVSDRSVNPCTYQVVKLTGKIIAINYVSTTATYATMYYRLAIGDEVTMNYNATSTEYTKMQYADYAFNKNGSICFKQSFSTLNLSKTPGELVFGQSEEVYNTNGKATWTSTLVYYGDLYMIYVGGDKYYPNLVFTSDTDIVPDTLENVAVETVQNPECFLSSGINLDGQMLKLTYRTGRTEEVALTSEMLDAYTLVEGENTITGTYEGKTFSFKVTAINKSVTKVEVAVAPFTEAIFPEACDLKDGKITVSYNDKSTDEIALTEATLTLPSFDHEGEYTVDATYGDQAFQFKINVKAHTVLEAKALTKGTVSLVKGVYNTIVANANAAILLIQDEGTNNFVGVTSVAGEFGKATAMTVPSGLTRGDLLVVPVTVGVGSTTATSTDYNKIILKYNKVDSEGTAVSITSTITEHGKTYGINKTASGILEITTEQQLRELVIKNALATDATTKAINTCTYQIVKITNLKCGAAYNNYRRLFLGDEVTMNYNSKSTEYSKMQYADYSYIKSLSVCFNTGFDTCLGTSNSFLSVFGDAAASKSGTFYTDPLTYSGDVYLIYVGGSAYYATLNLLSLDDLVPTQVQ